MLTLKELSMEMDSIKHLTSPPTTKLLPSRLQSANTPAHLRLPSVRPNTCRQRTIHLHFLIAPPHPDLPRAPLPHLWDSRGDLPRSMNGDHRLRRTGKNARQSVPQAGFPHVFDTLDNWPRFLGCGGVSVFGEDCGGVWVALEFGAARGVTLCCFAVVVLFTLILQVIGGAMAAMAGTHPQEYISGPVASLLIFGFMCMEFAWRVHEHHEQLNQKHAEPYNSRRFKIFLCSPALATTIIFARPVFRVTELSGRFGGHLANDEVSYTILEGAMIIIASLALTIMHPGIGFGRVAWAEGDWHFRSRKGVVAENHAGKGEGEVLNGAE